MRKKETLAILTAGGPAPGINGVISAATIEAVNRGLKVIGILDGFKWLIKKDWTKITNLTINNTSRIHNTGGSIIGISRDNPTQSKQSMANVISTLKKLKVDYLIAIGGDGTLFLANELSRASRGRLKIAHVPKTIDNNIALPGYIPTFGFETARHIGTREVQNLMEDARTTKRWFFVVTMGRKTGHLALGIGRAASATISVIPEEFGRKKISLDSVVKILAGSVIKRLADGNEHGVAIISEGIANILDENSLSHLQDLQKDEFGRVRFSELDLGQLLKKESTRKLVEMGIDIRIVDKRIGYELRSAPPIPFDAKYTRDLGYSAVKFLLQGGSDAMVTIQRGKMVPIGFDKL
ncbi:MAG TPA: 6-phosphofructokinase, partial [Thermodesulfobacteriota bacterium]|nr:6-phosphofructokinase [Thermodesulfobacteriota bacterium]